TEINKKVIEENKIVFIAENKIESIKRGRKRKDIINLKDLEQNLNVKKQRIIENEDKEFCKNDKKIKHKKTIDLQLKYNDNDFVKTLKPNNIENNLLLNETKKNDNFFSEKKEIHANIIINKISEIKINLINECKSCKKLLNEKVNEYEHFYIEKNNIFYTANQSEIKELLLKKIKALENEIEKIEAYYNDSVDFLK
ncbi:hypothetical protein COBT_002836, partial [Conglomerata obtusa]